MGFYYMDGQPPEKPNRFGKYVPQWIKNFWADTLEILVVIKLVFGIILPVLGVIMGFIVLLAVLVSLLSMCAGSSR
jgi:hypothetical protein